MSNNITNETVLEYLSELYENKNNKLSKLRDFAETNRVPIILRDTEGLLIALAKLKKPARVLEIGTAVGYSACIFANSCDCEITTIEADSDMADAAELNIGNLGFDKRISVLRGEAREILEELQNCNEKTEKSKYDLVFIDASKSHYREFWDLSEPLLSSDGIIICDNILMSGMTVDNKYDPKHRHKTSIKKMREFIEYILSRDDIDTCILPVGDGVSISLFGNSKKNWY